jgi:CRP-like cAMP-binding protein
VDSVTVNFNEPKGCNPFQLSLELQEALAPISSVLNLAQGEVAVQQGDSCRGVYIVRSGLVRVSMTIDAGKDIFKRILGPGTAIGLPATLCSQPYALTATCQNDCILGFIEAAAFQEFLRTQPLLCMEVVRLMGQELSEMNDRRVNFKQCRECGCSLVDICEHELGRS